MMERRSEPRPAAMASGVTFLPRGGTIDCFLESWPNSGAHLLVVGTTNIADSFTLESAPLERRRLAQVMWRARTELGVRFRLPKVLDGA